MPATWRRTATVKATTARIMAGKAKDEEEKKEKAENTGKKAKAK